jgi:hypothetical protein
MYGLKLYITLEDMNDYIRTKVNPLYKDLNFIPLKAEINENDLSLDITLISADPIEFDGRYKLDLDKLPQETTK